MDVEKWLKIMSHRETDFKELSKMKKSKIMKKGLSINDEGKYVIKPRKSFIDLCDYLDNVELYENDINCLMSNFRMVITDEDYNEMYMRFRFCDSNEMYNMSLIHFTFNMVMWLPLFALNIPVTKEFVFMPKYFNNNSYIKYINEKIINPFKHLTTHNEMSQLLSKMYDIMIHICEKNGISLGLSFSLYDLIKKWDDPEIYDICHTKLDKNIRINEAEDFLKKQTERLMDLMLNDPEDNILKPLIRARQGISEKQLREFCIHQGFICSPAA